MPAGLRDSSQPAAACDARPGGFRLARRARPTAARGGDDRDLSRSVPRRDVYGKGTRSAGGFAALRRS